MSSHCFCCGGIFDWDTIEERLADITTQTEDGALWDDPERAQTLMRARARLEASVAQISDIERELAEHADMMVLAQAENDDAILSESEAGLLALQARAQRLEVETLLSGEVDGNNVYIEIHAGAGGTESQDWANMLLRMYLRWAEQHGFQSEITSLTDGEEAGIKSATIHVKGDNAFGWIKTESGVHRLVRISPFDANKRRHTSFASVWCYPEIDDSIVIEILPSDVRVDTYRASGAGGQHINTTDSAVRITHIPSGIVVQCQSERSQHSNRATAWMMLRARLYEQELQKRETDARATADNKTEIGWGHQIRSYVLQPYQMVKDLRTGITSSNPQQVLDGAIDIFIEGALSARIQAPQAQVVTDID